MTKRPLGEDNGGGGSTVVPPRLGLLVIKQWEEGEELGYVYCENYYDESCERIRKEFEIAEKEGEEHTSHLVTELYTYITSSSGDVGDMGDNYSTGDDDFDKLSKKYRAKVRECIPQEAKPLWHPDDFDTQQIQLLPNIENLFFKTLFYYSV